MDWAKLIEQIAPIAPLLGMFIWLRIESHLEVKHFEGLLKASEMNTQNLIIAIHKEIKDFHGRLCAIEENRKK